MPVTILISDDSPIFRQTLRHLLESIEQWQVIETRDGEEAVSRAIEAHPDVVVLDLAMPVKDGLTACREITKALPDIPILMCTMHNSPQMELEAQKAGARGTLSKENSIAVVPILQQLLEQKPATPASEPAQVDPVATPILAADAPLPTPAIAEATPEDPAATLPDPKPETAA